MAGRVVLFLPTLDDGGAERVMLQLGESLRRRGYGVELVVAVPGGPLDSQVPADLERIDLGARRTLGGLRSLVRHFRRTLPAVVLSTLEHSNLLVLWARALARTKVRIVLREANVALPAAELRAVRARIQRMLMRRFYPRAEAVIAVSEEVRRSLIRELGLAEERVHTVYNPVIDDALQRRASDSLEDPWFSPGAPPVILGAGRLVPQKDFGSLVRAFAKARARRECRLVILGEGPDRAQLETLVEDLGLAEDVRLPGFDHNPFRWMARAAVFVLCSRYEGLPGALIQAMACGCRVVATDAPGGSREVISGSDHGVLVPIGDVPALAAAILLQIESASRGPARVPHPLDRFTERAAMDGYLGVLGLSPR